MWIDWLDLFCTLQAFDVLLPPVSSWMQASLQLVA
jgi:hypothetical protein